MRYLEFKDRHGYSHFLREDLVRRVIVWDKPEGGHTGEVVYDGRQDFLISNTPEEIREILKVTP